MLLLLFIGGTTGDVVPPVDTGGRGGRVRVRRYPLAPVLTPKPRDDEDDLFVVRIL